MQRISKPLIIGAAISVLVIASIVLFLNRHIFDKNYHVKEGKWYVTEYSECPDKIPFVETMGASYIVEHNGEKYVQFYDGKEYWETSCYGVDNIKTSYQDGVLKVTYDWVYSDDTFPGCLANSSWQYVYFTIKVDDSIKGVYANDRYLSLFPGGYVSLLDENYEPIEHKPMHEGSGSGRGRTVINDIITESGKIYHTYFDYDWSDDVDIDYVPAQTVITDEDYNPIYTTNFNAIRRTWEGVEYAGNDTFICNTKDGIVKINTDGEVIDKLSGYNLEDNDIGNTSLLEKCYGAFLIYSLETDSAEYHPYGAIDKDLNICIPTECKNLSLIIQDEKEYIIAEKRLDFGSDMKDMYANYTIDGKPLSDFVYDGYDIAVENLSSDIQNQEE